MGWVKLDDGFFRNLKIQGVGRDAKLLYLGGLCYSGASLTDGFIPRTAARSITVDTEITKGAVAIHELVNAGLWIEAETGYRIHDYLEHNTSSTHVLTKRDAARERMQRARSQNVRANDSRSSQNVRSTRALQTETETETESNTPPTPQGDEAANTDQPDEPPKRTALDNRWRRFWLAYPRRTGTGAAEKAFHKLNPSEDLTCRMIAAVEAQKLTEQWARENGRFVPLATTWINQTRWRDEIATESPGPSDVELLPGERVEQIGPGAWDLLGRDGRVRKIRPNYFGVIWDERQHAYGGGDQFYRDVAAAKAQVLT